MNGQNPPHFGIFPAGSLGSWAMCWSGQSSIGVKIADTGSPVAEANPRDARFGYDL